MELLEDLAVVGDDQQGVVFVMILVYSLGNDPYRIHVQTGVDFIQQGQFRFQHAHLENFIFLPFPAGKAVIHIPVRIAPVHGQSVHFLMEFFPEGHDPLFFPGNGTLGIADEVFHSDSLDGNGSLEGHEDPGLGSFIHRFVGDFLAFKINVAFGHNVFGVAHNGVEQGGFAGTVGAHDHMSFAFVDDQIQAFQDFLTFNGNFQSFHA